MPTEEALKLQEVVELPEFQRLLTDLDEDAETAEKEVDSFLANANLKWLPSDIRAEATKDRERVRKADALFHAELEKVAAEKGDHDRLMKTYDAYSLTVGALQQRSAYLQALSDARVLQFANGLAAFLIALTKSTQSSAEKLQKEFETLDSDLAKAKKQLKEAEAQAIINGVISVVSLFLPHVRLATSLVIGAGKIGANAIIDEVLGPRGASGSHSAQHSLFEIAENYKELRHLEQDWTKAQKGFIKGAAGLFTLMSDLDEIDMAKKIVSTLTQKMSSVEQRLVRLLQNLKPMVAQMPGLHKALSETKKKLTDARFRKSDAKVTYERLRKLLENGG
jgi:hypothetical protein